MKRHTVKQVSRLSGVSVRALHFYDEIGLLRPAAKGENGYRYYEREQLLQLQQILFYRKLGFPLEQIREILGAPGFDKIRALKAHRVQLAKDAARVKDLIRTIDKTIASLEGEKPMKEQELYRGFDAKKQEEYEQYVIAKGGKTAEDHIAESKRRTKSWTKEDWERVKEEGGRIFEGMKAHIERGAAVADPDVQAIIQLHYQWICRFWTPTRESYSGLGKLYVEHPDFRKFYEPIHPKLAGFLAEAMRVYADARL